MLVGADYNRYRKRNLESLAIGERNLPLGVAIGAEKKRVKLECK